MDESDSLDTMLARLASRPAGPADHIELDPDHSSLPYAVAQYWAHLIKQGLPPELAAPFAAQYQAILLQHALDGDGG